MTLEAPPRVRRADVTRSYQEGQYDIRRRALAEYALVRQAWNLEDLDGSWPVLETAMLAIIERYYKQSSNHAARYYRMLRAIQGIEGDATIVPSEFDRERIRSHLVLLGPIFTKKALSANRPDPMGTATVRLAGVVTAGVLDGGRDTLLRTGAADPRSAGWRRVTQGTCEWCRKLAGWGAFHRNGAGWQGHTNCRCVAEPQWENQADPPESHPEFRPVADDFKMPVMDEFLQDRLLDVNSTRDVVPIMADRLRKRVSREAVQDAVDSGWVPRFRAIDEASDPFDLFADAAIDEWAVTSGDSSWSALSMQRAAAERWDLPWPPKGYDLPEDILHQVDLGYAKHRELLLAFVDEMQQETQIVLKDLFPGQTHVRLSRGVKLYEGPGVTLPPPGSVDTAVVTLNPLSSFSLNNSVANSFGNVKIIVDVPIERIIGTPLSGFGVGAEYEFVVRGSAVDDIVSWARKGESGG